jgi:cob(I)alamin adenosyltransferase
MAMCGFLAIHPMKIYTKTGDRGDTGLFGGERVRKDHGRIRAYGTVDEVNAVVGWARASAPDAELDSVLKKIQNDLFDLGAVLATPDPQKLRGPFIGDGDIRALEAVIDRLEKDLEPLRNFILPGGGEAGARLHVARTVCRRSERDIVTLTETTEIDPNVVIYMNRLSDLLFVMARWANWKEKVAEEAWTKKEENPKGNPI